MIPFVVPWSLSSMLLRTSTHVAIHAAQFLLAMAKALAILDYALFDALLDFHVLTNSICWCTFRHLASVGVFRIQWHPLDAKSLFHWSTVGYWRTRQKSQPTMVLDAVQQKLFQWFPSQQNCPAIWLQYPKKKAYNSNPWSKIRAKFNHRYWKFFIPIRASVYQLFEVFKHLKYPNP